MDAWFTAGWESSAGGLTGGAGARRVLGAPSLGLVRAARWTGPEAVAHLDDGTTELGQSLPTRRG